MKTSFNSPTRRLVFLLGLGLFFSATAAQAQDIWVGGATANPTEYALPANWSLGRVPGPMDDARIPVTTNSPMINNLGIARRLTIDAGATLTIGQQGNLDLYGDLIDNGTLTALGSITTRGTSTAGVYQKLDGSAPQLTLTDLIVQGTPGVVLQSSVLLSRLLSLTGNLITTTTGPLTLTSNQLTTAFVVNTGGVVSPGSASTFYVSGTDPVTPTSPTLVAITTGTGIVTMQRAINITTSNVSNAAVNAGLGYRHYSSPVTTSAVAPTGGTVADLITSGFNPEISMATTYNDPTNANPQYTRPYPTVYFYDQAFQTKTNNLVDFDKGWYVPTTLTTPLPVGRGVTVNLNGSQLEDFVGTPNNGTYRVDIARNVTTTINASSAGYVFLGNPYPSPIDFRQIVSSDPTANAFTGATPTSTTTVPTSPINTTLYVYQTTGQYVGAYRSYSATTGVGNPIIPSGQAFFVRVAAANAGNNSTTGTLPPFYFRNTQRVTGSDFTTFMRPVADTRFQLELTLGNKTVSELDYFNLVFQPGSTTGNDDQYDAVKMPNTNGMSLNTTAPNGDALSIDARPAPTTETVMPLQLKVAEDGTYTLNVSKLANLNGLYAYLRDKKTGTLTDLSQQASYTFTANAANTSARFELVVSPRAVENAPAALADQVSLYPNPARNSASLELPASIGSERVSASLIDAMGRTVRTVELPAQGSLAHQLDLSGLASGVYALRLRTSAGTVVNRLTVE